jgi:hypothetical protein
MFGLPDGVTACLFDMDGVVTQTAVVHAAAWKEMFDDFLRQHAEQTGTEFAPFDAHAEYDAYVDGKPRPDGTRGQADELKKHGADIVVRDLIELLDQDAPADKGRSPGASSRSDSTSTCWRRASPSLPCPTGTSGCAATSTRETRTGCRVPT